MKDWILKILAKIFLPSKLKELFSKLQDLLKGKKSYLAGAAMILQGIILAIEQFAELKGLTDLISWVKEFLSQQGTILIMQGLAVMGIRSAVSKQTSTDK
jgi:hypothetical protein